MAQTIVGIGHLTMLGMAPPDWVSLAAEAGFDAVGIRARAAAAEDQWPMAPGSPMLAETLRRLADTGTEVLDVEIVRLTPATQPSDYAQLLETGQELGASFLNVMVDDPDKHRVRDNFAALVAAASKYGLRPAVEAIPYMQAPSLQAAAEVVGDTGGGILIDPLHLHRSGQTADDVRSLDPKLLAFFQMCDAPLAEPSGLPRPDHLPQGQSLEGTDRMLESRAMRLLPGDGELPLAEVMSARPAGTPVAIEAPALQLQEQLGAAEFARRARRSLDRLLEIDARASTADGRS